MNVSPDVDARKNPVYILMPALREGTPVSTDRLHARAHTVRQPVRDVPVPLPLDPRWAAHAVALLASTPDSPDAPSGHCVLELPPSLAGAHPSRIATFLAGRYAATRALVSANRGRPLSAAIGLRADGAPRWPRGFVGSISHTVERAIAVVAPAGEWMGIGIDCERLLTAVQADEIAAMVVPEGMLLDDDGGGAAFVEHRLAWPEFTTVVFSAKESLYKCLRPIVGTFFDFTDARVVKLDPATGRLRLRLARHLPPFDRGAEFDATFVVADGHVHTVVAVRRFPVHARDREVLS